jgi:hypothetical protein
MALSEVEIQEAYIAFFNRPADVPGLDYWKNYTGDAPTSLPNQRNT